MRIGLDKECKPMELELLMLLLVLSGPLLLRLERKNIQKKVFKVSVGWIEEHWVPVRHSS